jgi:membrane-bound lytic murein transglycosylase D
VPIERDMDVAVATQLAGMKLEEFQHLNPQMNRPVILAAGTPQVLLPYDNANRFVRELPRHRGPLATWTAWTAPKTMKTAEAARAVGMSEESLREVNHIPARMLIKAGSTLVVPRGNALLADVSSQVADTATLALAPEAPPLRKTSLKAGKKDSVASVAKRYRVSPAQVAEWNDVSPGATFAPGQTIVVYTAAGSRKATSTSKATRTARSKPTPGGPRGTAPARTASSGKTATGSKTAPAGKATEVRPAPVARR